MEIKKLACELESWAQEKGWKTVTQLIPGNGLAMMACLRLKMAISLK
ncbi:hypothetical protein ACN5LU_001315 [Cronobacter sakazakii]